MDLLTHHFYKIVKVGFVNTQIPYIYSLFCINMRDFCISIHNKVSFLPIKAAFVRAGNTFGSQTKAIRLLFAKASEHLSVVFFHFLRGFASSFFVHISLSIYYTEIYRKSLRFFRTSLPTVGNTRFSAIRKYRMSDFDILPTMSCYSHQKKNSRL